MMEEEEYGGCRRERDGCVVHRGECNQGRQRAGRAAAAAFELPSVPSAQAGEARAFGGGFGRRRGIAAVKEGVRRISSLTHFES